MKTSSTGESSSSSKGSLSKNLKKTSKSRSRTPKSSSGGPSSSQHTGTTDAASAQTNSNGKSTTESKNTQDTKSSSEISKEKVHRSYAGFGPKTIKTMCEQHEGYEMDILPEVYSPLAEDLTYRVWELVNSMKTYARHSGGNVTCDLLNEVLKYANVPPVIGASEMDWDRIEYDGTYYYNPDEIVELRDEYLKEVQHTLPYSQDISSFWAIDRKFSKNLLEFHSSLNAAIFLGDDEAFSVALDAAAFTPQIGVILKLILKSCISTLAFDQKPETVDRCLRLLTAITINPHSRDVDTREEMFHLAELLVCLLLDTYESIKPVKVEPVKEESFEMVKHFLETSESEIRKENAFNQMDVDDIRSEYEALFQMMERDGFQEREHVDSNVASANELAKTSAIRQDLELSIKEAGIETPAESSTNSVSEAPIVSVPPTQPTRTNTNSSTGTSVNQNPICETDKTNEIPPSPKIEPIEVDFSPYKTEMCEMKYVDLVCSTIGHMGSQFGYFQSECMFLISKRLEKFFSSRNLIDSKDQQYLSRAVRGLVALGEHAFRELIPFLEKAAPESIPEWMYNDFSVAAMYLRGRDDIFLYEWLEDLCGDKLCPFLVHFHKYLQKRYTKLHRRMQKPKFVINAKVLLKTVDVKPNLNQTGLRQMFAGTLETPRVNKPISFRYSGGRPLKMKPKGVNSNRIVVQKSLKNFHKKIVIGRRKLLKPLTDKKKCAQLSNFCYLCI